MFACGYLGIDIDRFYSLTPRQYTNIARGIMQRMEQEVIRSWEQTREIAYAVLMPNTKKGHVLKKTDVLMFPWDEKQAKVKSIDVTSPEYMREIEKTRAFWERIDAMEKPE